eukprot:XP_016879771.1 monocarboxylate transporter 11 isoform X3 [Homo sapiens]
MRVSRAGPLCIHFSPLPPPPGLGVVCVHNSIPVGLASGLTRGLPDWLFQLAPALRTPRVPGGSGPCGDLCLPREPVQVGLHRCPRSPSGPPPAWEAERKPGPALPHPSPPRTARRGRTAMTPQPAGPPDGGWGWVVAAAAFAINGLSYGLLRSLGLAFPDLAEHFDRSAQDTAWISALALAVQQAASPVGSALSTRWGARPVVMVGGVLASLGFVFSAFASDLLHLYLGLGLLAGFLRDETGDFTASFLLSGSLILSGSFIYIGLPRALPSCGPASPPATPPPETGELLPAPQAVLLSPGGPGSTLDTTC